MSKSFLKGFRVGDKHYRQFIHLDDDRTTIESEGEAVLLTVNSRAVAFNGKGERIGQFDLGGANGWTYTDDATQKRTEFDNGHYLPDVECRLAKQLLEQGLL